MKLTMSGIWDAVNSPKSFYKPEKNNTFSDKKFSLKPDYDSILTQLLESAGNADYAKKLINECRAQISESVLRSYDTDLFVRHDSMNLQQALGLNSLGQKYPYVAIYDISNLLPLILSSFFGADLNEFENKFAKYLVSNQIPLFQFNGAYSSRWSSFFSGLRLSDFGLINSEFDSYVSTCYQAYKSNKFMIGGVVLDKTKFTFKDMVGLSLRYYIMKAQECILNNIMIEKVQDHNGELIVQSKGIDNLIIGTSDITLCTPVTIEYGIYSIVLEPTIVPCKSKTAIGEAYLNYRMNKVTLLTSQMHTNVKFKGENNENYISEQVYNKMSSGSGISYVLRDRRTGKRTKDRQNEEILSVV